MITLIRNTIANMIFIQFKSFVNFFAIFENMIIEFLIYKNIFILSNQNSCSKLQKVICTKKVEKINIYILQNNQVSEISTQN